MPKIALTQGSTYRYSGTDGVYQVILGELVEGSPETIGIGGGDPNPSYIVIASTSSLPNARYIQNGTGIAAVDGGSVELGGTGIIRFDISDSVVATISGSTFTGNIGVNGGSLTTTAATFNLVNANATTVNFAGAANAVSIGKSTGTVTVAGDLTVNGGDITLADTANIKDSGGQSRLQFTNTGNTQLGNSTGATSLVLSGSSTDVSVVGALSIGGNQIRGAGSVSAALSITGSNVSVGGNLEVVGSEIGFGGTISNIGSYASNTRIDLGGYATTVNIGAATGTTTIKNAALTLTNATSLNLSSTSAVNITHTGGSGQNLTISSTNANVLIESSIFSGNDVSVPGVITAAGNLIRSNTGATVFSLTGSDAGISGDLTVYGGKITLTNGSTIDSETINILKLTESDVRIIGATLSTDQANFNLINTTATTVNAFGAATAIVVGSNLAGSKSTINSASTILSGSFRVAPETVQTDNYTLAESDHSLVFNISANRTLSLPDPNGQTGRQVFIKRIDSNAAYTLTLSCSAGAPNSTVEGLKSYNIGPRSGVILVAAPANLTGAPWSGAGSDWMIL